MLYRELFNKRTFINLMNVCMKQHRFTNEKLLVDQRNSIVCNKGGNVPMPHS